MGSALSELLTDSDTVHLGESLSTLADPGQTMRLPTAPPPDSEPSPSSRQVLSPIQLDRVDRSILQAVDLDPSVSRLRAPLPEGAEVWLVAPDDELASNLADRLTDRRLKVRRIPWGEPATSGVTGDPGSLPDTAATASSASATSASDQSISPARPPS